MLTIALRTAETLLSFGRSACNRVNSKIVGKKFSFQVKPFILFTNHFSGGKHCGQDTPSEVFTTTGDYLALYFQSDNSNQFRGFDMVITTYHTGQYHWCREALWSRGKTDLVKGQTVGERL